MLTAHQCFKSQPHKLCLPWRKACNLSVKYSLFNRKQGGNEAGDRVGTKQRSRDKNEVAGFYFPCYWLTSLNIS